MKATKFALVFAFVAFATMIFAQEERPSRNEPAPKPAPISIKISLEQALLNHGLVRAMYQQLDTRFLQNDQQRLYTAKVKYHKVTFVIYGTLEAWKRFFVMDINDEAPKGKASITDEPLFKSAK